MLATPTTELIDHIRRRSIPAAFDLLPARMASPEAVAMLLAIGLQESAFRARRQGGHGTTPGAGPARGFWQFERFGGVKEILTHSVTGPIIRPIAELCLYAPTPETCHAAIEHHDVLAICFARLLLWVDPRALPPATDPETGWRIYLANWRPGKPHPLTWPANFRSAWAYV